MTDDALPMLMLNETTDQSKEDAYESSPSEEQLTLEERRLRWFDAVDR